MNGKVRVTRECLVTAFFLMFVFCRVRYSTVQYSYTVQYSTIPYRASPSLQLSLGSVTWGQPRDLDCIVLYCIVLHVRLISPPMSWSLLLLFRESTSGNRKRAILDGGGQSSVDASEGKKRRVD